MATLVLGAIGSAFSPLGGALGALGGSFIDQLLFPQAAIKQEGPRLSDLKFQASTEGAVMPRVWAKMRVWPQVIWATNYKETKQTETSGGKGGQRPETQTVTWTYSATAALSLCDGPIVGIAEAWFDGKLVRLADYTYRLYLGTEDQGADPKILEIEGADRTSAYRGTAYIVFEDLPLEKFGNRFPQMSFVVIRRPPSTEPELEDLLRAVTLIPGTTEFGYATTQVSVKTGVNETEPDNSHASGDYTDLVIALDRLENEAPDVRCVSLVVAWHGTDLRCGHCELRPKVERADRVTQPFNWQVANIARSSALVVSTYGGAPAAGGAPSDRAVYEAIKELKNRNFEVTLYPFILMDIAAGNGLPDPYGGAEQAPYPWRGRITCDPAPGRPGSADKTADAGDQVGDFFGSADASDFGWDEDERHVNYAGPNEWRFRRLILHLARIAKAAGGVDRFLIGSEMIGITQLRSDASTYPAVAEFIDLAAEVRALLPDAAIGYGADWSEYHSHRPADGSDDVFFNLDPLWADANIDFVGIDIYLPLSDWRDGAGHLDKLAGTDSIYDLDYLRSNVEGGEYYDWYYADRAARDAQARTDIIDTGYGKDWVFRQKDIRNWWLNDHYNRPAGVEDASATDWVPQSKPVHFTELGCPAVDKGSNQPNVFVDPKSSESFYPYYSLERRDDAIQRAYLSAMLDYWKPSSGNNPVSSVYGERMIDWERIHVWTWDARPYPEFPQASEVWADAGNWKFGHWLTGRLGLALLANVVNDIASGHGAEIDVSDLQGLVWGYLVDQIMSPRDMIAQLMTAYFFDAVESEGKVAFRHRGREVVATYGRDDLAAGEESKDWLLNRGQESELPRQLQLNFVSPDADYRQGSLPSRRLVGATGAVASQSLALALPYSRAQGIADALLMQVHAERERGQLMLPPSALALDAGDVIALDAGSRTFRLRVGSVGLAPDRSIEALREDPEVYDLEDGPDLKRVVPHQRPPAPPLFYFMDLPLLRDEDAAIAHAPRAAAYGLPWQPVAIYRAPSASASPKRDSTIDLPATIGLLAAPLARGPVSRWDDANVVTVEVGAGTSLASAEEIDVLNGGNVAAIELPDGLWEILQWQTATLVAPRTYELSRLLRGQLGTDADMVEEIAEGTAFIVLDDSLIATNLPSSLARSRQYWKWGPASRGLSDALYDSALLTFQAIGLRPYAPVHVAAARDYAGGLDDVTFSWVRRSRLNNDSWDGADIPLGEESEAYELDILDGDDIKRTLKVAGPEALYTAAQQTSDWGTPPSSFDIAVYQRSAYGRGAPRRVTIDV